jgi:hypothetical protein
MRTLLALALLAASSAFATGEKVVVPPQSPLHETLCFSMSCQASAGGHDAQVTTRAVKGGLEVTVLGAQGQVKLVTVAATDAEGHLSSTDLVRTTSQVLKAIEGQPSPAPAPKAAVAAAPKHLPPHARLLARR